jgi:hypothetical protein
MGRSKKPYSSTTGTKPSDWGVDPLKPYSAPKGGTIRVTDLHKQAKAKVDNTDQFKKDNNNVV